MKTLTDRYQKVSSAIAEAISIVLAKAGLTKTEKTNNNIEKAARKIVKEFQKREKKNAETGSNKNSTITKKNNKSVPVIIKKKSKEKVEEKKVLKESLPARSQAGSRKEVSKATAKKNPLSTSKKKDKSAPAQLPGTKSVKSTKESAKK